MDYKYKTIVIGIDQSYTRTGISIVADGELKLVTSTNFKGASTKPEKRKQLAEKIYSVLGKATAMGSRVLIICERIRTFSKGKQGGMNDFVMSMDYIKATSALIGRIVDTAYEFDVPVYSVDTRSWKSKVVGTSKAKGGDKKLPTIEHVIKLGFKDQIVSINRKGKEVYDDDAADSACIALYGFLPKKQRNLKREL